MKKFLRLFFGRVLVIIIALILQLFAFSVIVLVVLMGAGVIESFLASIVGDTFAAIIDQSLSYMLSAAQVILTIVVSIYIVNSKVATSYKITWLFVVGVLAFFGTILYLLFANKSTNKRMRKRLEKEKSALRRFEIDQKIEKELHNSAEDESALSLANYVSKTSGQTLYKNSEVTYFKSGEDAWPFMLDELSKAEHYIFLEYFIVEKGVFWDSLLEILEKKAKEGVDVRVMYDDLGSVSTLPVNYPKRLKKMGIKCVPFNRLRAFVNIKVNNRDHRKILVIDGKVGFTGGINLADEYVNHIERFGYWKDNSIRIKGEGVYGLTQLFLSNWLFSNNIDDTSELFDDKYLPKTYKTKEDKINESGYVQPYGDIPFDNDNIGQNVYLKLINGARKYIYITTPYLIIDDEMNNALCRAAMSGIDVHVMTPHIPDKKLVFGITRSHYAPLIKAGVKIHEFTPGFIHEKMFIVDDIYGTVGTINLDYRSLYLHLENGTFMYKCDCLKEMKQDYEDSIKVSELIDSNRYKKIKRGKGLWWGILRVFCPML